MNKNVSFILILLVVLMIFIFFGILFHRAGKSIETQDPILQCLGEVDNIKRHLIDLKMKTKIVYTCRWDNGDTLQFLIDPGEKIFTY